MGDSPKHHMGDSPKHHMGDSPKSVNLQIVKNDFLKVISSVCFFLKSIAVVSQRPKMQFSPIHTKMERYRAF